MSTALPELDRIDLKILACLQDDGRISNLKLAENVALSPCHPVADRGAGAGAAADQRRLHPGL